jgi:hypothetical protein
LHVHLLINAVVRETTALIAQLATSGGLRAPLAHLADQMFRDLSRELEAQGVSRKVSADMFGMALRSYLRKVQKVSESRTDPGRTLWQAAFEYIEKHQLVTRADVIRRFSGDDEGLVRGVLHDLAESGLVFATGVGQQTAYRAVTEDELGKLRVTDTSALDELLGGIIYKQGPISLEGLSGFGGVTRAELDAALARLLHAGRITHDPHGEQYSAPALMVPLGASAGWEASVYSHFHALVQTISTKLRRGTTSSEGDAVGGSTFTFVVWDGHPLAGEAEGFLPRFRREYQDLYERVRSFNQGHARPPVTRRVVVYGGQCVTEQEQEQES